MFAFISARSLWKLFFHMHSLADTFILSYSQPISLCRPKISLAHTHAHTHAHSHTPLLFSPAIILTFPLALTRMLTVAHSLNLHARIYARSHAKAQGNAFPHAYSLSHIYHFALTFPSHIYSHSLTLSQSPSLSLTLTFTHSHTVSHLHI